MDAKMMQRLSEKVKRALSPEEREAFAQCSTVMSRYPRIGALVGSALGVYGMYRRKLWPLTKHPVRALVFGGGGAIVGLQMGLLAGTIKSVQVLRALPDPDHIMKLWREIQIEMQDAKRRPFSEPREWTQRTPGNDRGAGQEEDSSQDGGFGQKTLSGREEQDSTVSSTYEQSFASGDAAFTNTNNTTLAASNQSNAQTKSSLPVSQKQQSQNIWSQIRGENAQRPETAWDRLRRSSAGSESSNTNVESNDDSPFSSFPSRQGQDSREPSRSTMESDRQRTPSKDKEQDEFDRLIERERRGEAEDARRTRNKFGDYN